MSEQLTTADAAEFNYGKKKKRVLIPAPDEVAVSTDDYTYEYLLKRLYEQTSTFNDAPADVKIPRPMLSRGGIRIKWSNFKKTCQLMRREPAHVYGFIKIELGISDVTVSGDGGLVIRGRVSESQLETLIGKYINEYVKCRTCKKLTTTFVRDRRLLFKECVCGTSTSVTIYN